MTLINMIKGFFIGIALVIPGLSASIFAVVVGLYEDLLAAINHFKKEPKKNLLFLWPILLGIVIGILASTKGVLWLCATFPIPSYAFFIGLVVGIFPFVFRKMKSIPFKPFYLFLPVIGFFAIYGLTLLGSGGNENYVAIPQLNSLADAGMMVFSGAFSVSLMAIPGVSGAIMLMVISQYGTVYHAVGQSLDWLVFLIKGQPDKAAEAFQSVSLIFPFLLGAIIGLVLIAKLLGYLLAHFEALVYYTVSGIVTAAAVILFQTGLVPFWPTPIFGGSGWIAILLVLVFIGIGIACTLFLDKPKNES